MAVIKDYSVGAEGINREQNMEREQRNFDQDANNDMPPSQEEGSESTRVFGAAIFGAIAGFLLGGSRTGVVMGMGAGLAATTQTAAGDVARAMGDVAITAGHKAREVDQKHNVVRNTTAAAGAVASTTFERIKEFDEKHHVSDKSKEVAKSAYRNAIAFENKHNIVENAAKKISEGASFVATKLSKEKRNGD